MANKKIIILVGPSGSGKTSIGKVLEEKSIPRLITTTTRKARVGEIDGRDYYFEDIVNMNLEDFVEQTKYNKNCYGLTKKEVHSMLEKNNIVHVSLDKKGAKALKRVYPKKSFVVFVKITEKEMVKRMRKRGDSEEQIIERITLARASNELSIPEVADLVIENISIKNSAEKIIKHLNPKFS